MIISKFEIISDCSLEFFMLDYDGKLLGTDFWHVFRQFGVIIKTYLVRKHDFSAYFML